MKKTIDADCPKLTQIMNDCLKNNFFPHILETAEITPCFKKGDKNEKENYRPVSILPNVLKGFERLIYNQLNEFIERKFSKFFTGFSKKPQYTIRTTNNDRKLEHWCDNYGPL